MTTKVLTGQKNKSGFDDLPKDVILKGNCIEMMQGLPEQIAADLRQYQDLGVSNFIIGFQGSTVPEIKENMERFSREVMTLVPE